MENHKQILSQSRVLELNSSWMAIGTKSIEQALRDMATGAFLGMVIDGESMYPVAWEDWLKLEPLDDLYCVKGVGKTYRAPTVIIAKHYHKMPLKRPALTREAIFRRDGWRCSYTGKQLARHEASIDHVVPKSKAGKWDWTNLVTAHVEVNQRKGNRSNEEAGLSLQNTPRAPKPVPVSALIQNKFDVRDWNHFLMRS
jgi:5-methylcytosine-specific restriction endonuclease McrA